MYCKGQRKTFVIFLVSARESYSNGRIGKNPLTKNRLKQIIYLLRNNSRTLLESFENTLTQSKYHFTLPTSSILPFVELVATKGGKNSIILYYGGQVSEQGPGPGPPQRSYKSLSHLLNYTKSFFSNKFLIKESGALQTATPAAQPPLLHALPYGGLPQVPPHPQTPKLYLFVRDGV